MAFNRSSRSFRTAPLAAAAALLLAGSAFAQQPATQTITISGRGLLAPSISGFGDAPLLRSPFSAVTLGNGQIADAGISSLGNLTRLDASVGDAYNAEGYWSQLSVRGYTLDNRYNYRRDGLPINAETAIALDNKERLELLKGASGIQAGTSAPGGLVNLVVKRPDRMLHRVTLAVRDGGSVLGAVDLSGRFGPGQAFGLRLNAAYEHLDPLVRDTQGHRSMFALAGDWRLSSDTLLEAEFESSRQTQPSVAGFSMLGDSVPDARQVDPTINLNRQPWRQPVEMNGSTASLRLTQRLSADWRVTAHAMTQHLKTNDRTAFPYGVYNADYECPQWCDRYAPDGSFSYWEYVSDNERRHTDALDLSVHGRLIAAGIEHRLQAGVTSSRYRGRFQDQVFDLAGPGYGNVNGTVDVPPSAGYTDANTNRSERSTEWSLKDAMKFGDWSLWAGLRHTRLQRESARTSPASDGLRATSYSQSLTTPWLALAHQLDTATLLYASWGQGMESEVAPNRARYTNAGQALPALKSRQFEAGIKRDGTHYDATLAWFDIDRPQAIDQGSCDSAGTCTRVIDGSAQHRGLEARVAWRSGPWNWQASAMWLDAQRRGSRTAGVNGLRPVNVPEASLRAGVAYRVAAVPGLELNAGLTAEGDRMVLPDDNSVRIPGWARVDVGAKWVQSVGQTRQVTWRAGIDNLADRRAWKESPNQFGHVYLYPLAPRQWRLSAEASF
jgi:iron complex outermembrane recepter protein